MSAMPVSTMTASAARKRVWLAAITFTIASLGTPLVGAEESEPVTAVLKARELNFYYRSAVAFYPCHELQNSVAVILRAVGARDDIQVRASGCEDFLISDQDARFERSDPRSDPFERSDPFDRSDPFNRPDPFDDRSSRRDREQSAQVRVRLMTPVEVTPQVLAEIDKDKSRRELISRVTGNPIAMMNDPIVFAAKRQTVTLSQSSIRLEPRDCQLLEQMSRSIFRDIDVRVVRGNTNCDRRRISRIAPQVTVEALLPTGEIVPLPGKNQNGPAAGQGSATQGAPTQSAPTPSAPAASEPSAAPAATNPENPQ